MSHKNRFMKAFIALLILCAGALIMVVLIKARPTPEREETAFRGVLVETLSAKRSDYRVQVQATGTVQSQQEIGIVPQVSGLVTALSPNLVTGGFVKAGEELFSIEKIDFQLALDPARAGLHKAELELETAQARAQIALDEWFQLHPNKKPSPLVANRPQLKSAEAAVSSARAILRQARLNLQRTRVTAPFNGYLRSESVDPGQYLRAATQVATLVGTDVAEIIVPLPLDQLKWLDVPQHSGRRGSPAEVRLSGTDDTLWTGWVDRSLGEVDPRGRMARIAVRVEDPYGLKSTADNPLPLAVGSFVHVLLQGKTLRQVVKLPRLALREKDRVWLMDAENRLRSVAVEVVRREADFVLIDKGLKGDEKVIVSSISAAADGLLLRTAAGN